MAGRPKHKKKPDNPEASGFSHGKPDLEPARRLLLEALHVLGRHRLGAVVVVLSACTETECNRHQSHKSNLFHSVVFLFCFAKSAKLGFLGDQSRENKHFFSVFPHLKSKRGSPPQRVQTDRRRPHCSSERNRGSPESPVGSPRWFRGCRCSGNGCWRFPQKAL